MSNYIIFSDWYYGASDFNDFIHAKKMFTHIIQPLLFEVALLVATEVHNRDVELKNKVKDKTYKMSLSAFATWHSDNLTRFLDSKPVMSFTAFKMFTLNRTMILTSLGVAVTYNLLILQFNFTHEELPVIFATPTITENVNVTFDL